MQSVPLSHEEIKTIKGARNQVLASFIAIGLIVSILIGSFLVVILKSNAFAENTNIIFAGLLALIISTFIFFLYRGINKHIKDLKAGTKEVFQTIIDDKNTHTNWGWHGNAVLDLASKGSPRLVEYYLITGEYKYFVDEETYQLIKPGDRIEISLTHHSGIILGIKKNSSI
jgi:hypothetical protein